MKFVILLNILLIIGAVRAETELDDDSGEETTTTMPIDSIDDKEPAKEDDKKIEKHDDSTTRKPVSFFYGQQSHSVFNANGNGIVVSSRFDSDGHEEKYISIGSPKIRIDGDHFTCTNLTCPEGTFQCHVTSEAIADDLESMKTKAECQDKEGKSLESTEYVEPNPYPKAEPPFSRVANVDRNGGIDIEDSTGRNSFNVKKLSKEEQAKIDREIEEQNRRIHELFQHQQQIFHQQMDEFNRHMADTFNSPNFPFGNYNPFRQPSFGFSSFPFFGNNWPFTSNFGFSSGFPFGNSNPFRQPANPFVNPNPNPNPFEEDSTNFDTIDIDRPSNTFYVETSNPTNTYNPHNPHTINPYMRPQRPTQEIETHFDGNERDNEVIDDSNDRIMGSK